jgi:hypothetical protein
MSTLYPVVTASDCYHVTTCRASTCPCIKGIKRAVSPFTSNLPLPRKRQVLDVWLFSISTSTYEFRWKTARGSTKYPLRFTKHFGVTITFCTYKQKTNTLHGLSPRANYTDRETAACRRSNCQLLRIKGATWSAWQVPTAVFSVF